MASGGLYSSIYITIHSLINYLCTLDTTLRILDTWYKLHDMNVICFVVLLAVFNRILSIYIGSRISDLRFGLLSDLIHESTGNGLRHTPSVTYIEGPLWYHINTCLKRGLIHRDRESPVIRPLLYLQATTSVASEGIYLILYSFYTVNTVNTIH